MATTAGSGSIGVHLPQQQHQQQSDAPGATGATVATVDVAALLSVCIEAAQRAGDVIRATWHSGDLQTTDKGDDDPMTMADVRAQRLIVSLLRRFEPRLAIVAEEDEQDDDSSAADGAAGVAAAAAAGGGGGGVPQPRTDLVATAAAARGAELPAELRAAPLSDVCVFVDPLDGTKEFTLGNLGAVTTLLGVAYRGQPVAGVIYQPFVEPATLLSGSRGTMVWGMRGVGVHGLLLLPHSRPVTSNAVGGSEGQRAAASSAGGVGGSGGQLVLTTTRTHSTPAVDAAIAALQPHEVIRTGGAGYKALLLLQGLADVYVFPTAGTSKWDTCGPEAVLRAAGGVLTQPDGSALVYAPVKSAAKNANGFVAALSAQLHERVVRALSPKL